MILGGNQVIGYAGDVLERVNRVVPVAAQLAGGLAAAGGLYLLAGLAWTLLLCGIAVVAVGTLVEGGRL